MLTLAIGGYLALSMGMAFAQANFYQGKTITVLATRSAGGTGDLKAKAVTQFLTKHIPVNPTIVIQYMDGGGGRKGTNHLYSNERPDGLTIGSVSGSSSGWRSWARAA